MQRIQEELEEVKKARRVEERGSPPPPYEANYSVINPLNGIFKDEYQFTHTERYPPYLRSIPAKEKKGVLDIFDFTSFVETTVVLFCGADLVASLRALAPSWSTAASMQELVSRNQGLHMRSRQEGRPGGLPLRVDDRPTDMYFSKNVGLRDDWYTDEVFGQQQFTGTNPTTIKIAPRKWIESFKKAANIQRKADVVKVLNEDAGNIFVQDYSDFRQFMGMPSRAELKNGDRHGCAAVALFRLEAEGKLHPLAIVLDYKGSMEASVTIFNWRINSNMTRDQERDWPWRYAKMCAQVSDWMRHEVAIHLVNTHLVEEVIIVAAHRTLNSSHIVFQLLEPHWATTLPLNKAARETLVPKIINRMTGCTADQTYRFLNASFDDFDWTGLYIPNDLKKRGFPTTVEELDGLKYHNYGYARNILRMWHILRSFVTTVLKGAYPGGDGQVAGDLALDALCQEVRSFNGGRLSSFPASLKTLDDLIDFVTMCIHIASPQHTAVNYLQQYYQTFVPNKPSALYKQLPRSLDELNEFEEVDLLLALPLHQPKDWLLMAQVPYLLSFEVPDESTILSYAMATSDHRARQRGVPEIIKNAAQKLKDDLESFIPVVEENSRQLDDQKTPYLVLDPSKTAISILI
ncbi:hypothetical protein CVT26_004795 [Gymnopilus dilepis]|uniref:Manganese lipoxygenase n=1 Tax=Gymnopilus dilepis TaxID=231916 RepID=A0A409XZF1_9AGAR|nr:hypothetical protein CVT26_004795 [Gymnopilus dilepis]